jgi:hypothetical protein
MLRSWTPSMAVFGFVLVQAMIAPVGKAAMPLRIAVASHAIPVCGDSLAPAAVRDTATARLAAAGITVSSIHTARLDIDFDCVVLAPNARSSAMVVHECLIYSELVSAPSNANKSLLATTWRKCESYTCSRANCTLSAKYGGQLLDAFQAELLEHTTLDTTPHPAQAQSEPTRTQGKSAVPTALIRSVPQKPLHSGGTGGPLVYAGIIMNCLCVLVYWQIRRRPGYTH